MKAHLWKSTPVDFPKNCPSLKKWLLNCSYYILNLRLACVPVYVTATRQMSGQFSLDITLIGKGEVFGSDKKLSKTKKKKFNTIRRHM